MVEWLTQLCYRAERYWNALSSKPGLVIRRLQLLAVNGYLFRISDSVKLLILGGYLYLAILAVESKSAKI